jgi:hypothetical protein
MMAYDAATGTTLMFGGGDVVVLGDTWSWNGSAWTQLFPPTSPPARDESAMTYDAATGTIILFGGCTAGGNSCGDSNLLGDTWSWNGSTWTQLFPATSPPARAYQGMAYDAATGSILLFGGQTSGFTILNDTWSWNGSTWTELSSPANCTTACTASPPARGWPAMSNSQGNSLLLFGGQSFATAFDDTWTWNGTSWTEVSSPSGCSTTCTASPSARWAPWMAYDAATSTAILFGGATFASLAPLNDTWSWNGSAWTQVSAPAGCTIACSESPQPRWSSQLIYDAARGTLLLFGGYNNSVGVFDDTWVWTGSVWSEVSPVPPSPSVRSAASMVYDAATGTVLLFGGSNGPSNDTWSWSGGFWTQLAPATSPPARTAAAIAYDETRGTVLLFGGCKGSFPGCTPANFLNDTWSWNGSTWTELSSPSGCSNTCNGPSPRQGAGGAYDSVRRSVVLFGGTDSSGELNDTWYWNDFGLNWTELSSPAGCTGSCTASPTGRQFASMAADAATKSILLFGGVACCSNLNDTWSWNGFGWTELSSPANCTNACNGPSDRLAAGMTYDASMGGVLLFGGDVNASVLGDTWFWNGTTWTQLSPASSPLSRGALSLAYDAATGTDVLFGGGVFGGGDSDTWQWAGDHWSQDCGLSTSPASPPCVLAVSPASGPAGGGNSVTILGSGFQGVIGASSGETSVLFGGAPAANVWVVSDGIITVFTAPPGSTGETVDVQVTTSLGASATSAADQYTYAPPPDVSGISPTDGPAQGGTSVTLSGSGFSRTTSVSFGGTPAASFSVGSDTSLTAVSPPGTAGARVGIQVTTAGGTSLETSADRFIYLGPPTVTGISPSSGPVAGGTTVTITGTNFNTTPGETTVQFGANQAQLARCATCRMAETSNTTASCPETTLCYAFSPAGSGVVDVRVTVGGVQSATSSADLFTYLSAPSVSGLSPTAGVPGGGTTVTINGSNFSTAPGTTGVSFGGSVATSVSCASTSLCYAASPSGTGTVDVRVTVGTQMSPTNPSDTYTYDPAPQVAAVHPRVGSTTGGTAVTLSGSGFSGATAVAFGGTLAATFTVDSDGSLTVTAPAGTSGATVDVRVTTAVGTSSIGAVDGYTFLPVGDVNADLVVNSVDALCILRQVASLPNTQACPDPLPGNPDVNGDGKVTSVDALCVLRLVAKLPSTLACPTAPAASQPSGSGRAVSAPAAPDAPTVASGTAAGAVQLTLQRAAGPAKGRRTTLTLTADATGATLGAWTIDLTFDPQRVSVLACDGAGSSICNLDYATGVVRVTGASGAGLSGRQPLATVTVEGGGAADLRIIPRTLTDPAGTPLASSP